MSVFVFSGFRLDTVKSELSRDGELQKVEPQTIAILEYLVERAGQLVTKEELIDKIWNGRIIDRSVLDNRIRSVRQAIGDTGKAQAFVKTYPNRGYKFIAPVESMTSSSMEAFVENAPANQSFRTRQRPKTAHLMLLGLGTIALMAIAASLISILGSSEASRSLSAANTQEAVNAATLTPPESIRPIVQIYPIELGLNLSPENAAAARNFSLRTVAYLSAVPGFEVISMDAAQASETNSSAQTFEGREAYRLRTIMGMGQSAPELNVTLQNVEGEVVVWSKRYELENTISAQDGWEELIARNIALAAANKLGLSTSVVQQQTVNFDIAADYQKASRLMRKLDPESIEGARALLNGIIEREPDYLPAYAGLYDLAYTELNFTDSDLDEMYVRMEDVAEQMRAIAPEAPETLTVNALDSGFDLSELTQASQTPLDLLLRAVAEAPGYFRAHEELAHIYHGLDETEQALTHYNEALRLFPNCPIILADKSGAQMCHGDILQAMATARLNVRRNPTNLVSRIQLLDFAMETGDYDSFKDDFVTMMAGENVGYQENLMAMDWHVMIGDYDTALQYAMDPNEQAYVHALRGDRQAATQAASEMAGFYASARAMYMLGDDSLITSLLETEFEQGTGVHTEGHKISLCHAYNAAYLAYVAKSRFPEASAALMANLQNYFDNVELQSFKHFGQYLALAGMNAMNGDADGAIEVISKANDEGFVFLGTLQDPIFDSLRASEAFEHELQRMRARAAELREQVVLSP